MVRLGGMGGWGDNCSQKEHKPSRHQSAVVLPAAAAAAAAAAAELLQLISKGGGLQDVCGGEDHVPARGLGGLGDVRLVSVGFGGWFW
jgi:hypothetical protein